MNDGLEMHTIHSLDNRKHGYSSVAADKPNLLQIDNISKPLKAISSYKVQELLDFCEKLHLWTFKTPTLGAVMSDKDDADWALSVPNGVKSI